MSDAHGPELRLPPCCLACGHALAQARDAATAGDPGMGPSDEGRCPECGQPIRPTALGGLWCDPAMRRAFRLGARCVTLGWVVAVSTAVLGLGVRAITAGSGAPASLDFVLGGLGLLGALVWLLAFPTGVWIVARLESRPGHRRVLRALALVRSACPFLVPFAAMSGAGIGPAWMLFVLLDCAMAERLTASASPVAGSRSPPWMRLAVYPLCIASLAMLLTVRFPVSDLPLGLLGSMLGWFGCLAIGALAMWHRLRALGFEERRAGLGGA